jgi:thioredoxin-related protein
MKRIIVTTTFSFLMIAGFCQQTVPTAKEVLDTAYIKAAAENKNILLIFRASWCGWCRKMDNALNNAACKKYFDDNYVITHLTVLESGSEKNEENKGADELLKQYKALESGIPFWVVLDKQGNVLRNSFLKNADGSLSNIGCPASESEVAAFTQIIKATSALTGKELAAIAAIFRLNDSR